MEYLSCTALVETGWLLGSLDNYLLVVFDFNLRYVGKNSHSVNTSNEQVKEKIHRFLIVYKVIILTIL